MFALNLNSSMLYLTSNEAKLSSRPRSGYSHDFSHLPIQSSCELTSEYDTLASVLGKSNWLLVTISPTTRPTTSITENPNQNRVKYCTSIATFTPGRSRYCLLKRPVLVSSSSSEILPVNIPLRKHQQSYSFPQQTLAGVWIHGCNRCRTLGSNLISTMELHTDNYDNRIL